MSESPPLYLPVPNAPETLSHPLYHLVKMKKNTSLPSFQSLLAFILVFPSLIPAAPYPPRNRQRQPHAHNEAHPIIPNHHHDSQYRQENETTSTVVIVPIKPDQDQNSSPSQQPPLPQDKKEEDDDEEKVEIRTPYKLTPQIIVVQRIVDRILVGVNDTANQKTSGGVPKEEAELENDDMRDEKSDDGDSARAEEGDGNPSVSGGDPVEEHGREMNVSKEHLRRHVGHKHGITRSNLQAESVQVILENNITESLEGRYGGEGDGEGSSNVNERRNASTSGPGPDDEGNERVAVLMGWTALVGVVGILAIAPAG